jgi:large subunit ribosomal protein L18
MAKVLLRKSPRIRRKLRVRSKIFGTSIAPRVSVFRSNKYIYGQVVDDAIGATLADVSAEAKKLHEKKTKVEAAFDAGKALAEKAKNKGIVRVTFDRNGYRYHGRVKRFADGLRDGGLSF